MCVWLADSVTCAMSSNGPNPPSFLPLAGVPEYSES